MPEKIELGLPYVEITKVANRDIIREHTTRGRETYYIDFKLLKIRDGFNLRKQYLEIPELADFIETNGLPGPLVVDMLENGHCFIEQGHRRFKALELLKARGVLKSLDVPGLTKGMIECFVNSRDIDELTRIKRQYSSNNGEKYTPLELGELCTRLFKHFHLTQVDIAKELSMSRQNVKNMMILADQPDNIKEAIKGHKITPTAAIDLTRKIADSNKRSDIIQEAVKKGSVVTTTDVKNIIGDKDLKELPAANISTSETKPEKVKQEKEKFDTSREEIKLCQRVIRNADKINTIASKLESDQVKGDIDKLVGYMQKDMVEIREYVHQHKRK